MLSSSLHTQCLLNWYEGVHVGESLQAAGHHLRSRVELHGARAYRKTVQDSVVKKLDNSDTDPTTSFYRYSNR